MICEKCNRESPDDSRFCQYCGSEFSIIEALAIQNNESNVPANSNSDSRQLEPIQEVSAEVEIPTKKSSKKATVFWLVCIVLLAVCGYLFYLFSEVSADNKQLNERIEIQDATIKNKTTQIDNLKKDNTKLQKKANYFDDICESLTSSTLGYAASNFKASESVIVVNAGTTDRKFTLTANWPNGGSVSTFSSDYGVAYVDFDLNSWNTSTKMTVVPVGVGVAEITFTNDVDNNIFSVVIIVPE